MKLNISKMFLIFLVLAAAENVLAAGSIPYFLKRIKKEKFVAGEVLVKFKNQTSSAAKINSIKFLGAENIENVDKQMRRVKIPKGLEIEQAIEQFQHDPNVEYAQPNFIYHTTAVPNDPSFGKLWGLRNTGQTITSVGGPGTIISTNNPGTSGKDMDLVTAWNYATDCSSILVAVIDSGVNYNQSDLAASMWDGSPTYPNHGYDFVDSDNDPMDKNGHGTHVAGTIGAVGNNSVGITGVCWKANIMALRVADAAGSISTANTVQAINFAIARGVKVINMSLGGPSYDAAFNSALTSANNAGIISVVAAGNENENNEGPDPSYPCKYAQSNIICVAALDQSYSLASFSNFGTTSVDVGAPGVNVVSTWPGTHTTTSDALTSGWSNSTTVAGGQWGYKQLTFSSVTNTLANPYNYDHSSVKYPNDVDARIWKSFNLAGAAAATVDFYIMIDSEADYDGVLVYANSNSGDPVVSGTVVDGYTGSSDGYRIAQTVDVSDFVSANTTIGFNMISDSSNVDYGANISLFSTTTLTLNTTSYNAISGTSMATPHVAGLVALVWAYNPGYTAADVVAAVTNGGETVSALASKTVTGKAVNALGSLSYITTPSIVSAVKQ